MVLHAKLAERFLREGRQRHPRRPVLNASGLNSGLLRLPDHLDAVLPDLAVAGHNRQPFTERLGHPPMVPPTVVGDAAGALGFAFGMVSALLGVRTTGQGCVVDGAIVDVLAMLSPIAQLIRQGGGLESREPSVFHDSPFYDSYLCSDGRYVTVGAIEPQFYTLLLNQLELSDVNPAQQMDKALWPALKARIAQRFAAHPSAHWSALMSGTDSCFAPVLTMAEAATHPHNVARGLYCVTEQGDIETARGLRFLPLR